MPKRLLLCVVVVLCTAVVPVSAQALPADGVAHERDLLQQRRAAGGRPLRPARQAQRLLLRLLDRRRRPRLLLRRLPLRRPRDVGEGPGRRAARQRSQAVGQRLVLGAGGLLQPAHAAVLPVLRRALGREQGELVRLRGLRGAVQDRRRRVALARRPVPQHRQPADRLQPLRPRLPRRQPLDGARPEEAARHAGGGGDRAARDLHPDHRPRRLLRLRRAHVPVLLAQRLPQLGVGHRSGQVHRGVEHLRGRDHQRLVERPARADDADDRAEVPRGQRGARRAAGAAARRLDADPRLRPRQAGVGERRRQRLRGDRRREEGPPLGGGLEHASRPRARAAGRSTT